MSAAEIALALGDARREGRGWRCRCPLHNAAGVSLSITATAPNAFRTSANPEQARSHDGKGAARRWRQRAKGTKIRNFKF
jgi:hypothetical protein